METNPDSPRINKQHLRIKWFNKPYSFGLAISSEDTNLFNYPLYSTFCDNFKPSLSHPSFIKHYEMANHLIANNTINNKIVEK